MMGGLSDHQKQYLGGNVDGMNILWEDHLMGGISDHQERDMGGNADEMLNGLPWSTPTTSHFPCNLDD